MPPFTDLEVIIYDTVCFKDSLYEFGSAWFVQMLPYFGFTIHLALLRVFRTLHLTYQLSSQMHGFLWRTSQCLCLKEQFTY